tara:strand:- start:543 stop:812 length:270 start_codon:yes stop_codon:yes gene_type:complete
MQIGPIRWIFIKSPSPHQPFTHIRKLYNVELVNFKSKHISELEKKELLVLREKTKKILLQKKRKEMINSIIILAGIMISAIIFVYFIIK